MELFHARSINSSWVSTEYAPLLAVSSVVANSQTIVRLKFFVFLKETCTASPFLRCLKVVRKLRRHTLSGQRWGIFEWGERLQLSRGVVACKGLRRIEIACVPQARIRKFSGFPFLQYRCGNCDHPTVGGIEDQYDARQVRRFLGH